MELPAVVGLLAAFGVVDILGEAETFGDDVAFGDEAGVAGLPERAIVVSLLQVGPEPEAE